MTRLVRVSLLSASLCLVARAGCPPEGLLDSLGQPLGPFEGRVQRSFALQLERLASLVNAILVRENVCFWMDQGTLLSMWRHGAPVMRYDTDVDIGVDAADVPKVMAALSGHSELQVVDWVEKHGVDHIEVTLWKAPHARMDVYFFHRRSVGNAFDWWSSADFLEPADEEVLMPLRWMVWGDMRVPVPSDPRAWLSITEPDVYHAPELHIPDKNFDWRTGHYARREGEPFQPFPLLSILAWLPSQAWAEVFAEALRGQDYPLSQIEVAAIGVMVPPSLSVSEAFHFPHWHQQYLERLSGAVACFWDAQAVYGPHRLSAQAAPILAGDGHNASALDSPEGPALGSACWRPGGHDGHDVDGVVLDQGDGALWSGGVGRRKLDMPEMLEEISFPAHILSTTPVARARWTRISARVEL